MLGGITVLISFFAIDLYIEKLRNGMHNKPISNEMRLLHLRRFSHGILDAIDDSTSVILYHLDGHPVNEGPQAPPKDPADLRRQVRAKVLLSRGDVHKLTNLMRSATNESDSGYSTTNDVVFGIETTTSSGDTLQLMIMQLADYALVLRNGKFVGTIFFTHSSRMLSVPINKFLYDLLKDADPEEDANRIFPGIPLRKTAG